MNNVRPADFFSPDPVDDMLRGLLRPLRLDMPQQAPQIRVDVKEDESGFIVKADIPGVSKEDIDVRIEGNQVSLTAEMKKAKEDKEDGRTIRSERYHGFINRTFSLGSKVDQNKALAKYENGVLELRLPKMESSEARRLTIK